MKEKVMTVLGPINQSDLGFTSMHEHLSTDSRFFGPVTKKILKTPDKSWFSSDAETPVKMENLFYLTHGYHSQSQDNMLLDEELMTQEVNDFYEAGGSSILEVSIPGIRKDVESLKRISESTGVHIIASTGLYAEESWPKKYLEMSIGELVEYMLDEIENGIENSNIKPGHIKFGPNSLSKQEEKALRAMAHVTKISGLSLTLHQGLRMTKSQGQRMAEILIEEGADPERVIFAHMDKLCFNYPENYYIKNYLLNPNERKLELDYAKELLQLGFNLSFDTFGHTWHHEGSGLMNQTDYERLAALVALVNEGYSEKLVVGCDVYTKTCTRRYGGSGHVRLLNFVVPILREVEIHEKDIDNIVRNNPARLLARL